MQRRIRITSDEGVATLLLARPEKRNAFDDQLIADLSAAVCALDDDPSVEIVLLAAEGACFSAGGDLDWMRRAGEKSRAENLNDAICLAGLMRTLDRLSKPTIALVQGAAYGGAVGLIACCDIGIAAETAVFALSEAKVGLIPATIGPYVTRAIGARQARRYFLTAEVFGALEAQRIGLVHEVVRESELQARAAAIISALRTAAPGARVAAKQFISEIANEPIDDTLLFATAERIADLRAGEEAREGISAFLERRPPNWIRGEA